MKNNYKVNILGNDGFNTCVIWQASTIEQAIREACKIASTLTIETFTEVSAKLID